MESLIDSQHGAMPLLGGIAVLMSLNLCTNIAKFLWNMAKKKSELSDKTVSNLTIALSRNTTALEKIESDLNNIKRDLAQFPKFKSDIRRAYLAIRILSGDKWSEIRKEMMDDGLGDI